MTRIILLNPKQDKNSGLFHFEAEMLGKVFFLAAINLYLAEGLYINPVYDYSSRNQRGHTTVCVQIESNGAGSHEPYFMCKAPEFPQTQAQAQHFENYDHFNQQRTTNEADVDFSPRNQGPMTPQTLQFGNNYQQNTPLIRKYENNYGGMHIPITTDVHQNPLEAAADRRNAEYSASSPCLAFAHGTQENDDYKSLRSSASADNITSQGQEKDNERSAAKQAVDPEQYRTLLQEEILGAPDLRFSHDEMASIQNFFSQPEIPPAAPAFQIPPEYFNDPVLRTFYNLEFQPHAGTIGSPYLLPAMPEHNRVLQQQTPTAWSGSMRPTELPEKRFTPPFTFQPIFIAIPFIYTQHPDLVGSKQAVACAPAQNIQHYPMPQHINDAAFNQASYRAQAAEEVENSFAGNLSSKQIKKITEVNKNSIEPKVDNGFTKPAESSEENLFAEDNNTSNAVKTSENDEDAKNMEEEITTSTTRPPQTTAKSFKSLLNAAKKHALQHHSLIYGGVHPSNQ